MSGINGYLQFTKIKNDMEIKNIIRMMNKEVWHRGPDSEAIYHDEEVGLGVRTLSPGELSPEKHLLYNEDKTKILIFDGSIFKGPTLKEQLEKRGHSFFTGNSMEAVLHAYEEYGVDCFKMVDGMFSLALYDEKRQQLVLARDKAGQKPLYYYQDNYCFLFGSELKSLLATGLINKEINTEALNQYLQLTYIPAPYTIFKNIYKLSPGCYLQINLKGKVSKQSYWDLVYSDSNLITDYSECKRLLRKAVFNSVEERMSNIAPIGSFLSGGIDSTIITGVMSKLSKKPIDTFTLGFKEKAINESDMAKIVADKYRTNSHVCYLDYEEAFGELDKIVNQLDEPFADPAAIPTYMIAKFAKQYVKTVLTGDSGDELFAGYNKYLISYYSDLYRKTPSFLRKHFIEKIVYILPDNSPRSRKLRKVIANVDQDVFWQRRELMCLGFKENELNFLLNYPAELGSLEFIKKNYDQYKEVTDELSQALYTDFKIVLEGDMMTKADRMTALASLDSRAPLLSEEIIELTARIPSNYKMINKDQKIIFKDTFSDLIPQRLINAPKRDFGIPIGAWLKGALKKEMLAQLDEELIKEQGLFKYEYIQKVLEEHFTEKKNRANELWTLYVFQRWYRRYYEGC